MFPPEISDFESEMSLNLSIETSKTLLRNWKILNSTNNNRHSNDRKSKSTFLYTASALGIPDT